MSFRKAPTGFPPPSAARKIILEDRPRRYAGPRLRYHPVRWHRRARYRLFHSPSTSTRGFFPLTVEYSERMYAAGRIPGSFFRREIGRPSERETLVPASSTARSAVVPQGPPRRRAGARQRHFLRPENESDVLSITAASAAVMLSPLPFAEAVAGDASAASTASSS